MIDTTHNTHYENFRSKKLLGGESTQKIISLPQREEEMLEHDRKLERDEHEMNEVFKRKVEMKLEKLKNTEAMLNDEVIEEMRRLEREKESLNELRERFMKEKKVLKHLGFS